MKLPDMCDRIGLGAKMDGKTMLCILKEKLAPLNALDPRGPHGKVYSYADFFMLFFVARISGCDTLVKMQDWLDVNKIVLNEALCIGPAGIGYRKMPKKVKFRPF